MAAENDTRYDARSGPRDRTLRVGDREREAVGDILRQQHLDGRLDTDEFQQRLERSLTAKTYADLDQLIADFPGQQTEQVRAGRPQGRRPWPFALLPLALLAAVVLTGGHLIWLAVPLFLLFVVRPLFWRSWARGYGRGGGWSCGPRDPTRTGTRA
jgi:uncharacterized protein DUF1707